MTLTQGTVFELKQGLAEGRYDAIFSLGVYCRALEDACVIPVCESRLLMIASAGHPLAQRDSVSIAEQKTRFRLVLACPQEGRGRMLKELIGMIEEERGDIL